MTLTDREEAYLDALDNRLRPLNVSVEVEDKVGSPARYIVVTIGISKHAPRSGGRTFRSRWHRLTRLDVACNRAIREALADYEDLIGDALDKTDDEWDAAHEPPAGDADA